MDPGEERELVAVAHEAAARAGIEASDPRLLYEGSSVIIALGPEGPVLRAGGTTDGVRALDAHYAREVRLAAWLSDAGAPVVRPWSPPGPFVIRDRVVSLWARAVTDRVPSAEEAARGLRGCHRALRTCPGRLPPLRALFDEAERITEALPLAGADRSRLADAFGYVHR